MRITKLRIQLKIGDEVGEVGGGWIGVDVIEMGGGLLLLFVDLEDCGKL